ncbi:MAG TPA: histone deacetylase [Solirubrobacteraceae bacterium]|jgi:acetoin utilization deacetylase AcuC-like enzyme|nr:histone deacetylase [Solirubrobacteraceae bacterium]
MAVDTRRTGIYFTHPSSLEHDPRVLMPGHPDTPARMLALERMLAIEGRLGWERRQAPAADAATLERVHSPRLVGEIERLALAGGGAIDADTVVGEPSYRAALHAAGGACELARVLLAGETQLGFSMLRPSGHHAEPDRAMGFCLFDNVAVAAALAIAELGAERVLVLDWDVHHGNGTAEAFRTRADVLFASIHQSPLYPGTGPLHDVGSGAGEGYTINLPVPPGSGEELWLSLIEHVVVPAARAFAPDLILVSAGFDAHRADPLAGCMLETSSFGELARHLRDLALACKAPLGLVLEGGYEPVSLAQSVRETMRALGDEHAPRSVTAELPETRAAIAQLQRFWPL